MEIHYIYCFSYYDLREPSVRYRGKYVLEELKKTYGIDYAIVYPGYSPLNILHFIITFFSALLWRRSNSLIIFQNIYSNRIYSGLLKILLFFRKRNTLYDIDDADYVRFPPQTIHYFMRNCEACSTGSKALLDYAGQYNSNTFLLTSPVIPHQQIKKTLNSVLTIGWIGFYNAHKLSLQQLFFPALDEIDFKIRLILLGVTKSEDRLALNHRFLKNKNVLLEMPADIDWMNEEAIYCRIKEFDIGVSPLLNTQLNVAKSAFKLKQCMSCGVPVLASSLGENGRFLEEGLNGYFCENAEDYKRTLQKIRNISEAEYFRLSANALKSTIRFSLQNYCNTLLAYCRSTTSAFESEPIILLNDTP